MPLDLENFILDTRKNDLRNYTKEHQLIDSVNATADFRGSFIVATPLTTRTLPETPSTPTNSDPSLTPSEPAGITHCFSCSDRLIATITVSTASWRANTYESLS